MGVFYLMQNGPYPCPPPKPATAIYSLFSCVSEKEREGYAEIHGGAEGSSILHQVEVTMHLSGASIIILLRLKVITITMQSCHKVNRMHKKQSSQKATLECR